MVSERILLAYLRYTKVDVLLVLPFLFCVMKFEKKLNGRF